MKNIHLQNVENMKKIVPEIDFKKENIDNRVHLDLSLPDLLIILVGLLTYSGEKNGSRTETGLVCSSLYLAVFAISNSCMFIDLEDSSKCLCE